MLQQLQEFWAEALSIWLSGGWAMIALAVIALGMFGLGAHLQFRLWMTEFRAVPEDTWRFWIDKPDRREGRIGQLLDYVGGRDSLKTTAEAFRQLQNTEAAPFERDLRVMKILVSAAPLVGLLGTVTGMLATFGALSTGAGGDETMGMVAKGISEALITTETGLVVALPGMFFQYHLRRSYDRYRAFLTHLETVCTQAVYKRTHAQIAAA